MKRRVITAVVLLVLFVLASCEKKYINRPDPTPPDTVVVCPGEDDD